MEQLNAILTYLHGLGGHYAGDNASKIVVEVLPGLIEKDLRSKPQVRTSDMVLVLRDSIVELRRTMWQY